LAIPPGELPNLGRADSAVAVVNDDVGIGPLGRARQGAALDLWLRGSRH